MRNWHCACAPGLLGPPQPVMPLVLQRAVETSARSAPLSWSISGCSTSCTAVISWASEPSTTPSSSSSSSQMFPTAILNAVGDQRWPDLSWSVSCVAGILSARLSWSTISSPVPSSSPVSDSGYESASSPPPNSPPLRQTSLSFSEAVSSTPNHPKRRTSSVASQTNSKPVQPPVVNRLSFGTQTDLAANSVSCQTTPSSAADAACQHEIIPSGVQLVEPQSPEPDIINQTQSKGNQTPPESTPATTTCSSSFQTELPTCKLCGMMVEPLLDIQHLMHCSDHPSNAKLIETFLTKWESSCCLPKHALGQFLDLVAIFANDSHDPPTSLLDLCGPVLDLEEAISPQNNKQLASDFHRDLSDLLTEIVVAGTEDLVANPDNCDASAILLFETSYPESELNSEADDSEFASVDRNSSKPQNPSDNETYFNDDDDELIAQCYEQYDSSCIDNESDYDVDDY